MKFGLKSASAIALAAVLSSSGYAFGQTYEIIANFHTGHNAPQNILVVYGNPGTSGTITNNAGYSDTFTVGSTGVYQVIIPIADATISPTPSNNLSQKSLLISADAPISASALIRERATSDMTGLLTSDGWDDEYYALSHPPTRVTSQLTITASQDGTTVNITAPVNYDDLVANTQSSFSLDAGETLSFSAGTGIDVSGTHITSDKPIAVFTGNKCSNAYAGACDTMITQNWGVDNFATDYRIVTTFGGTSTNGDAVRIVASQNGTTVNLDGTQVATLDAGDVHVIADVRNSHITSNQPIQVVQVMKGGRTLGDPAMSFIPASTQWLSDYVFATPEGTLALANNYLAIGINQSDLASLTLNGSSVSQSDFAEYELDNGFIYGNLAIDPGIGTVRAANPFLAMLTGFDSYDSFYGNLATTFSEGISDPNLNFFTTATQIAQTNTSNNNSNNSIRDITQPTDVHTGLGTSYRRVFDGGTLSVGADLSDAFTIKSGGGSVTIASGASFAMSGVISNDGSATGALTKVGAGRLILSGANTFTGATTVSAGTLRLTGSLTSDVTVGASGRLEGTGSTSGDLTSSGVVAPGNSPGTLTVAGDVTFTSTNTFDIDIDGRTYVAAGGSGTYDRLAITGASSTFTAGGAIAPITRNITAPATNTFTPIIGDAFRVVTTANASGVSGTFASITQPTTGIPTNTRFDVVYGASYVDLVLTPDNLATFVTANGGNQNTVRAATALQTVRPSAVAAKTGNSGAYWTGLYNLNAAQTLNALEQSSGQIHAYSLSAIRSSNVALARFDPAATLRADADEALWVLVGGDWLDINGDTIASGFESVSRNVWFGADLHNDGDRRYGVAIGYSDSDVSTAGMGSAQTDTSSVMAYYFGETGNWNYSGLVSMGFSDIKTQRTVDLSTGTTDNASDSSAKTHIARLSVGYSQPVSESLSLGLNADVLRMHTAASGFTETGSAVTGLSVTQESQTETQTSVSLGLNWAPEDTNTVMGLQAGVDLRRGHDRISDRDVTLHSASWEVETPHMARQLRFVEAGFRTTVGDLFNADFEDADAYRINGNVRYTREGIHENTSLVLGISRAF